jgi:hypothetical protein
VPLCAGLWLDKWWSNLTGIVRALVETILSACAKSGGGASGEQVPRAAVDARADNGFAVDFAVEADRAQLSEIAQRVRDRRLRPDIGTFPTLDDAIAAFNSTERRQRKTIVPVRPRKVAASRVGLVAWARHARTGRFSGVAHEVGGLALVPWTSGAPTRARNHRRWVAR